MVNFPTPVSNATSPPEGPKSVTVYVDFSAASSFNLDFELLAAQGYIRSAQSMFVDNSANTSPVTITCGGSNQNLIVPANSQAYLPVIVQTPPNFVFTCANPVTVPVMVLNVPMPTAVWPVTTAATLPVVSGKVQVQDGIVESAVVSGFFQSQAFAVNASTSVAIASDANGNLVSAPLNGVPVSRSKVTVASTSTSLVAANTARRFLLVQAPATADVWLNLLGGTASVGGADCFIVPQGTIWQTREYVPTTAVTYFCATAALELACIEG